MGPAKIRRGDSFPFVDAQQYTGPWCVVLPTPTGVALEARQVVQLLMHAAILARNRNRRSASTSLGTAILKR